MHLLFPTETDFTGPETDIWMTTRKTSESFSEST